MIQVKEVHEINAKTEALQPNPCKRVSPHLNFPKLSPPTSPSPTMASFTPYTYFQCPCTDTNLPTRRLGESRPPSSSSETEQEDDRTFDPRAPRANFSLYPLEHLLYCEDCHQIRCPRCVLDEIVTWYCPNCLFEVPSGVIKSEGNRYFRLLLPPLRIGNS